MDFITATDLQAQSLATETPSQATLDAKYANCSTILTAQAQEGFYTADVLVGSRDLVEFTTWIQGYGFRVIASSADDATPVRTPIIGDRTVKTVSWQKFTVQVTPLIAAEGQTITYSIYTKGVADGTTLYWRTAGGALATDFQDTTLEGTVTINNSTGTVVRNVRTDALSETAETVVFNLYWDTLRTDLLATNSQAAIAANAT